MLKMLKLRRSVKGARKKFFSYLGEKKMAKEQDEKILKRKAVHGEISEVNRKKAMLEITIKELEKDADRYASNAWLKRRKICY